MYGKVLQTNCDCIPDICCNIGSDGDFILHAGYDGISRSEVNRNLLVCEMFFRGFRELLRL